MVQGVRFVIYYLVNFMGTVVKAGVTILAELFAAVVAEVPAAARPFEVSPAKLRVSFNFKWQFNFLLLLLLIQF
jgi:hypothetical protein